MSLGSSNTGRLFTHVALLLLVWVIQAPARQDEPNARTAGETQNAIRGLLGDELISRWYPRAVDREHGGFHQNFTRDWSPRPDDGKFLVYQARMTWTAAAYAEFDKARREEFLGYARHGLTCLDTVMRDREQGGFHWVVGLDGKVDARLGDEKHVYGISFVSYAASKLRAVAGDDLALKVARDAFDWLEAHAHDAERGGYLEALKREEPRWSPGMKVCRSPAARIAWGFTMGSRR